MRAQASFILIIALLFLIAVVIYYASQFLDISPVPSGVGEEHKMVQEMVEGIITSSTELSLLAMSAQGGYLIPPDESVALTYIGVPYWQICQNDISPTTEEIKERFREAITYYVNSRTDDIEEFFGKNLTLEDVSRVDVNLLDNKIDIAVYMPTKLQGYPIRQPYRISVPTKFKQLFDFAKDVIIETNKPSSQGGRFFEGFTTTSIYSSKYLPTFGMLTECGETLHLTPEDVSAGMTGLAIHTVIATRWWEERNEYDYYGINTVNGKQYKNLEPRILLPDGFRVESDTNIHIANSGWIAVFPVPIPFCMSAYDIEYSFGYPIVIKVNDSETGYEFNFAMYVNIEDMEAGDCEVSAIVPTDPTDGPCSNLECSARIKIEDCSGKPLSGAKAYFDSCTVGTSDSSGWIEGNIKCGTHNLEIYHDGNHQTYSGTVSSSNLNGATYKLCGMTDMTVHFNELVIKGHYGTESCYPCTNPSDCTEPVDRYTCETPATVNCTMVTLTSTQTGEPYTIDNFNYKNIPEGCNDPDYFKSHPECFACTLRENSIGYIPAGNYDVTVNLWDPETPGRETGHIDTNFDLLEGTTHLYINIPNFGKPSSGEASYAQIRCGISKLAECGKEPVTQT